MDAVGKLMDALVEEMQGTSIDRVSVEGLCARAGLSKQTFYRHYPDKYALMEAAFEEKVLKPFSHKASSSNWERCLTEHFHLMRSQMRFVQNGYRSTDVNGLLQCDINLTQQAVERLLREQGADPADPLLHFAVEKEVRGSVSLVREWVLDGMRRSDEQMARLITATIPGPLRPYLLAE